jgi:hypothetical protein
MPPSRLATLPHEEWVSSISCFVPGSALYLPHACPLTVSMQPLPHRFIRRRVARIRPRPDPLSHCALASVPHHIFRDRAIKAGSFSRRRSTRRNRLARSHGADMPHIARRDSDGFHAARDVALARCACRRCGVEPGREECPDRWLGRSHRAVVDEHSRN